MVNQQLFDYIKQKLEEGFSQEQIRNSLGLMAGRKQIS